MNPLLALFGGQAAAPGMVYNPQGELEEVLLQGSTPPPAPTPAGPTADEIDKYAGMGLDNTEAILQRDRALQAGQDAAQHKGMFGVKGTLRDVLGILGDAFLVQGGKDPLYMQKREQEKMSDALAGMSVDERAAIERATGLNPAMGAKMLDDYIKRNQEETQNLIRAQQATTQQGTAEFGKLTDVRDIAARLLGGADSPERLAIAIRQIENLAGRAGLTLEDLGVSAQMTPEEAYMYSRGDMRVNQQEMLPRRDRALDQADYRNRTGRISATRPTAPKSVTEATELARIRGKVNRGEKLSPGDAATWEKANRPSGSGSLLEQFIGNNPAPTGRFRPAKPR